MTNWVAKYVAKVSQLGAFKKEGVHVSIFNEWKLYEVAFYGSDKSAQLTSPRKKILKHKQSSAHLTAEKNRLKAKNETIESVCDSMNASHFCSTTNVFRSAYYIANSDRSYSDHFSILELQKLNGVSSGVGLHSRYSAVEIIEHVSRDMKDRIIKRILEVPGNISI